MDDHTTKGLDAGGGGRSSGACEPESPRDSRGSCDSRGSRGSRASRGSKLSPGDDAPESLARPDSRVARSACPPPALCAAWKAASKPAEIHVYDQVSAGFGMTKRGLPVDSWNDRLLEWLIARKLR